MARSKRKYKKGTKMRWESKFDAGIAFAVDEMRYLVI